MPHTNVSKLIYVAPTPKNTPTKAKLKSIHRYANKTGQKTYQNIKRNGALRNKDFSRETVSDEFLKNSVEQHGLKEYKKIGQINSTGFEIKNPQNFLSNKRIKKEKGYISDFKDKTFTKKEKNFNRIQTIQTKLDECIDKIELQSPRSCSRFLNSTLINKDIYATNHSSFNQTNKEVTVEEDIPVESKTPFVELKCFIKSQRENQNLDENLNTKKKNRTNKEEIKKRLKALHKNSLKILETNLKKGKKSCSHKTKISKNEDSTKFKKLPRNDDIFSKSHTLRNEIHYENEINNLILDKSSVKSDKGEISEKVGLLRHSVSDEHTFNDCKDYDINKDNELLKSLSISKFNLVTEKHSDAINISKKCFDNRIKEKLEIKSSETENQQEKNNRNKSEKAIQVEIALNNKENIPNLEKVSGSNDFINSVQLQTSFSNKKNTEDSKINSCKNIPYWLQQTSVEIYPYNFITAVRKKLEVLTNPVTKNYNTTYQEKPLSQSKLENDYMRRRIIDNVNVGKSNSNQMHSQILTKKEFHLANNINISNNLVNKNIRCSNVFNKVQNSDSLSDTISNFSSISLHCSEADTISDISSVKSEAQLWKVPRKKLSSCKKKSINYEKSQNDDTTISSSIFSSSEHKDFLISITQPQECHIVDFAENIDQSPSPLSLYNITNFQINLKRNNSNTNVNKNLSKKLSLKLKSETDIEPNNDDKVMAENDQNISQLDQLLEDFNKNLSQVVEVNNQLKTTLDKSKKQMNNQYKNTPLIPKLSSSSFITAVEYTSDFEDYVSNTTLIEPINNNIITKDNNHKTSSSKLLEDISSKSDVQSIKENIHDKASSQSYDNVVALNKIQTIISSNKEDFIKNHVNTLRGNDDSAITKRKSTLLNVDDAKIQQGKQNLDLDLTMRNEFVAISNKSDIEISMILQDVNSVSSKISQNYSSIGVYEQLLQSENLKTEHLTALLKIREKILVDRTKTQIAWLEVQKEKYKRKGLSEQIIAIKKKQRAILIKMEKKRGEIKKQLLKSSISKCCSLSDPSQ